VVGYKPAVVARLDPRTLRRLVLGDLDDDALHVIDPVRLRRLATIRFGIVAEAPQQLGWLGPRRVAVVAGNPGDGATLVMADPVAGRVLSRRQLAPAGIVAARAGDRLVLLRSPIDQIGPAQLSVVDGRGRIKTVQLPGIRAGFQNPPDWDRPGAYGITRDAGLAVHPAGRRAFVVTAGPTIAEVDLASLRVTYRQLRQPASLLRRLAHWLVPPAQAKQVVGTWTVRPLDPAAPLASWQAGRLLAYGGSWDDEAQRERGVGLTLYGPGDGPPRHLLGIRAVDDVQLNGELVYASVDSGGELPGRVVVSLGSGRVVASSDEPLPYLLLDGRDQGC
jgi:hypothetical protein